MAESIVASATGWIGSQLIQEANVLFDVADQIKNLKEELQVMQQYLRDADAKQHVTEVNILTGQIRKLSFNIEDVIDNYILKVVAKTNENGNRHWFLKFACSVRSAPHVYQVGRQLQVIDESMKRITDNLKSYGVIRIIEPRGSLRSSSYNERDSRKKPPSYPYDDYGEYIVGLDKEMSKLIEILMSEGNHRVHIVSIVGMGGSGKTTLARKLYNHPYSKECFDCCAWASISQEWSTRHVLLEILRMVGDTKEKTELNATASKEELVDKLRDILKKKSYLVVLDDVWRKEALEEILPAFPRENNKSGSKIIITTRNREVFSFLHLQKHLYIHEAKPLNEEDAWELFRKIALSHRMDCNTESFDNLGKEMLRKCHGLPLAILALAGILNTKVSIREWQQVREAIGSLVLESTGSLTSSRVGDILALSYDDLPYDLKPCFLYLGVFPEDYQIATGMLTRMWVGEGLITACEDMPPEDIAMQHLVELSNRFMIQVVKTNFKGEIKAIRLHDLLHDLCVKKAKEESFLEIYTSISEQVTKDASAFATQPRRAAVHSCVSYPTEVSYLRSLVLMETSYISLSASISGDVLDLRGVYDNFKLLRLLSLWGIKTLNGTLPYQIGSLVHLRYLGIRYTNITKLPSSVGDLRNLLTLDYRNIESHSNASIRIPDVLWKLVRLRHLFLPIECPWSIENLKLSTMMNLRTLWGVKEKVGGYSWLSREVPKLSATLKKLMIVVSREEEMVGIFSCASIMSDGLHTFHCELRNGLALRHVRPLSCHQHLHKLTLIGTIQMKLSLLLPANIIILELKDSLLKDEDPLAALGALAHLKLLRLSNSYLGTSFACEPGSFPQLEELYVHNIQNLNTWSIQKGAILRLKRLEIMGCKKFEHFPPGLKLLPNLQQFEFLVMPKKFGQRAREFGFSQQSLRLPHNCDAIIEQCDSLLDISSIHRLYEQLTAGVFLNNKHQKFWVVKQDKVYYNCFLVGVAGLSLATKVDIDLLLPLCNEDMGDWEFNEISERDGSLIKVATLRVPKILVLHIEGSFGLEDLSPNVTYTIAYVIMFDYPKSEEMFVQSILTLPNGRIQRQKLNLRDSDRSRNEWLRVSVGEFETGPGNQGCAKFYLHFQWRRYLEVGFAIKGAIIEPKF